MPEELSVIETSDEVVYSAYRARRRDSRKGENGRVLVVGGSYLYHGAPLLSALGASKVGVDLVYLAVPKVISTPIRAYSPTFIVLPLPDSKLTVGCVNKLLKWLPEVDAAVIGPGLGKQKVDGAQKLVRELAFKGVKVVLDADALRSEVTQEVSGRLSVLTPHQGEFKRIFNKDLEQELEKRALTLKEAASQSKTTILLKGAVDVISDGSKVAFNKTGTPAMTVGGTGDVLAGVVAAFLALGAEPFAAAAAGAYINGLAGELAAQELGLHISAVDVAEKIPYVLKRFDRVR
ncbi:MAG: NAD(P)H-hydrate dehydratase [Nitrososphaerales archaeon]